MVYTAIIDVETQVTGREDPGAERAAAADNRVSAQAEIDRISALRNVWVTKIQSTRLSKNTLEELSDKVEEATRQIAKLRDGMNRAPVTAGKGTFPKFLHENLGYAESTWATVIVLIKLLFPMLMRAFGLAVAIYGFEMMRYGTGEPNQTKPKPNQTKPNRNQTKPNRNQTKPNQTETKPNQTETKPQSTFKFRASGGGVSGARASNRGAGGIQCLPFSGVKAKPCDHSIGH